MAVKTAYKEGKPRECFELGWCEEERMLRKTIPYITFALKPEVQAICGVVPKWVMLALVRENAKNNHELHQPKLDQLFKLWKAADLAAKEAFMELNEAETLYNDH